jgi:hypothetical protein
MFEKCELPLFFELLDWLLNPKKPELTRETAEKLANLLYHFTKTL